MGDQLMVQQQATTWLVDFLFDISSLEELWDRRVFAWRHRPPSNNYWDDDQDEDNLDSWHPTFQIITLVELTLTSIHIKYITSGWRPNSFHVVVYFYVEVHIKNLPTSFSLRRRQGWAKNF